MVQGYAPEATGAPPEETSDAIRPFRPLSGDGGLGAALPEAGS